MLFDLRVVLAACLATFLFVAIGLGLLAASHSPFKPPKGYARNDGAALAGPGLPKSRRLPVLEEAKSEDVTGSIAETTAAPEPALEPAPAPVPTPPVPPKHAHPARPAPQLSAKKPAPTIETLIEQDQKTKAAPVKKRPRHVRHRAKKKAPPPTNPWSIFTTNNNNAATQQRKVR